MQDFPKVTVITITYNLINAGRKEFFRQCVESVHNQSYENIEHIVIDGASSDGTLDLIKDYSNQGWLSFYSEVDDGVYDAMNKGIDKSNGDFIIFLNSDDYFNNEDGIKISVKFLLETESDYSFAKCQFINIQDKKLGIFSPVIGSFLFRMPFCHQTMLTRKETLLILGKFDKNFKSAGDFDFVLRLCLSGAKFIEVPMNFVSYRLSGISYQYQEQSIDEFARSCMKNLSQYGNYSLETYRKMFTDLYIPAKLYKYIFSHLNNDYKIILSSIIQKGIGKRGSIYILKKYPKLESRTDHLKNLFCKLLTYPKKVLHQFFKTRYFFPLI